MTDASSDHLGGRRPDAADKNAVHVYRIDGGSRFGLSSGTSDTRLQN